MNAANPSQFWYNHSASNTLAACKKSLLLSQNKCSFVSTLHSRYFSQFSRIINQTITCSLSLSLFVGYYPSWTLIGQECIPLLTHWFIHLLSLFHFLSFQKSQNKRNRGEVQVVSSRDDMIRVRLYQTGRKRGLLEFVKFCVFWIVDFDSIMCILLIIPHVFWRLHKESNWSSHFLLSRISTLNNLIRIVSKTLRVLFDKLSPGRALCLLQIALLIALLVSCSFESAIKLFLVHLNLGNYWVEPIRTNNSCEGDILTHLEYQDLVDEVPSRLDDNGSLCTANRLLASFSITSLTNTPVYLARISRTTATMTKMGEIKQK